MKSAFVRFWKEWGGTALVLATILVVMGVVFQFARVPSGSMESTIPDRTIRRYFIRDGDSR